MRPASCPPLALLPLLLQGGITLVGSASFLEGRGDHKASSAGATLLGMGLIVVAEAVQAAQVMRRRLARIIGRGLRTLHAVAAALAGPAQAPLLLISTACPPCMWPCLLQVVVEDYFMSNLGLAPLTVVG